MENSFKSVPATKIKNRFGDYLGEVLRKREPILIERHGKPVAVLVDLAQWDHHTSRKTQVSAFTDPWIEDLKKIHRRMEQNSSKKFSAVELVRQIREEAL